MTLTSAFAIYFVLWWLVLFAVLPWGVRTQEEHGEVVPGSNPSAPHRPMMIRKIIATTIIAGIVFALLYFVVVLGGLTLDDVPFLPEFKETI